MGDSASSTRDCYVDSYGAIISTAKWLSEEALQIALKKREMKNKGEKERYSHLNAEFQRIARRDKKTFLRDH